MFWKSVGGVVVVLYPALIYYVLTQHDGRIGVIGLLSAAIVIAVVRLKTAQPARRAQALITPGALLLLAGASHALDDDRYMLSLPVLINAGLLVAFASTLREETPLVERFARVQVADLTPSEVRYCRSVTVIWSWFFVANGVAAGLLAWLAPVSWWALYTGLVAYLLVGLLGSGEYVVRKYRFGRFGSGLHDRLLENLLTRIHRAGPEAERTQVAK